MPEQDLKEHVNFFNELEKSGGYFGGFNKEHEEEKKLEQEKFEKKIGLLTYLGQDISNEVPWYVKVPGERVQDESCSKTHKNEAKRKLEDPLIDIRQYLHKKEGKTTPITKKSCAEILESSSLELQISKKLKHKKHRKEKSSEIKKKAKKNKHHSHPKHKKEKKYEIIEKKKTIEELRAERLKREKIEREKAEQLIKKHKGIKEKQISTDERDRQYNSQFNPHLVRQLNLS